MKKNFHVFFLFTLIAFFVTMANAETAELQTDPNTGDKFINIPADGRSLEVDIPEGVSSFKVHVDEYEIVTRVYGNLTLNAPQGYILQVDGFDLVEMYIDGLYVEDVNTGRALWGAGYYPDQTVYSTGRSVEVQFQTYEDDFTLDLTVTLIDVTEKHAITIASTNNGSVSSVLTEAAYGETVELSINPDTDYMLASMTVVDNSGKAVIPAAGWYSGNTVSFTMPMEAVTVTPVFALKDYSNLSINMPEAAMPESETVDVVLPEGVTSFKVYDGGGENAGSSAGTSGFLILRAPLGNIFEVTGNISTGRDLRVSLKIYSGDLSGSPILDISTPLAGGTTPVSVTSPGNVMTIGLGSTPFVIGPIESEGNMELTVTVTSVPSHEITLGDYTHGTIQLSKNEAYPGETVTLTTSAESGYILADIEVLDEESNPVNVAGVEWSANNTATFVMPNGGVVVTPHFTNNPTAEGGLYRRMQPYTYGPSGLNMAKIIVPEGVKSFKLYADQDEYCNPNGIVLSSADARTFLIEGSISSDGRLYLGDGDIDDVDPDLQQASYYGFRSTIVGPYRSVKSAVKFDYGGPCEDVDFTVSLVKTTQYAAITVEEVGTTTTATIDGMYNETDAVDIPEAIEVGEVVLDRTFSTSGYSTITLPFAIDVNKVDGLAHAYEFDAMGYDANGKKQVEMVEVSSLEANTPYIIEVNDATLTFAGGVTLMPTDAAVVRKGDWEFRGTFQKTIWDANHPDLGTVYGYSAEAIGNVSIGQFVKAAAGAFIRPFRAYLIYNPADGIPEDGSALHKSAGSTLGAAETLPDYIDVVVVSRDANGQEHKKVIGVIDTRTGEFKMMQDYDLKGRKLMNGQQKARGAYYGKMKVSK